MVRKLPSVLVLSVLLSAPAIAADKPAAPPPKPSFDCAKARGRLPLMICSDYDLAALDVREAGLLRRARAKAATPDAVDAEQDQWLAQRNACGNAGCAAVAYRRRIADLMRWIN